MFLPAIIGALTGCAVVLAGACLVYREVEVRVKRILRPIPRDAAPGSAHLGVDEQKSLAQIERGLVRDSPTGIGSGGNCTNPSWSTSDAEGTESIGGDTWWLDNDAWSGSHGPQSLYVCSPSSWYAISNQPDNGGQVETWPNTEYDVGGRGTPSTKTIGQYNSIMSTFAENFPTTGDSFDAAYDLWLNNWSTEIMIWNQVEGDNTYWSQCAEPGPNQGDCGVIPIAVTLSGVGYPLLPLGPNSSKPNQECTAATEGTREYISVRDNQVSSGSVDILAAFKSLIANGLASSSDVPTQLEYGVEITATTGAQTFPLTGLTFTLN